MNYPDHKNSLAALRRIEGQVRGVQRMVEEGKYCVQILHQIQAVVGALLKVEDKILARHFEACMFEASKSKSDLGRKQKLDEMLKVIHQFRRL